MIREQTAEVVILGAGVMGASVAWHLASRGCRDVLVVDRHPALGLGSTGKATGGFRAQFATEVNIRLSLLSREKLLRFPDEIGIDSGYRPHGYLFLANEERQMEKLRSIRPLQTGLGVPVREITPEDARELNPAVRLDGIVGGSFCPVDGFIRPLDILNGYAEAARRLGVRFELGVEVTGIGVEKRLPARVIRIETSAGPVSARHVVNATGAWAGTVGRLAGADIPVVPSRRPGRSHRAHLRAAERHADDDLPGGRLPPAGAGRAGAPPLDRRTTRPPTLSTRPSTRAGSRASSPAPTRGSPAWPAFRSTAPAVGPGSTRCRRTSTPSWGWRRASRTSG